MMRPVFLAGSSGNGCNFHLDIYQPDEGLKRQLEAQAHQQVYTSLMTLHDSDCYEFYS